MNKFILNFNKLLEVDLNILEFLNKINTKCPIDFYTSGTTGTPKKTTHSYDFIIKITDYGCDVNVNKLYITQYGYNLLPR